METGREQERKKGLHRMVQGLEEGARDSVLYSVGKGKVRKHVSGLMARLGGHWRNGVDGASKSEEQLEHSCADPGRRWGSWEDSQQVEDQLPS